MEITRKTINGSEIAIVEKTDEIIIKTFENALDIFDIKLKNCSLILVIFLFLSFVSQGKNVFKPNERFSPSFDLMNLRSDSLANWNVIMYGTDAKYSRIKSGNNEYFTGTALENQSGCSGFILEKQFYYAKKSEKIQLLLKGRFFDQKKNNLAFLIVKQFENGRCIQTDSLELANSDSMRIYGKTFDLMSGSSEAAICIKSNHHVGFNLDKLDILVDGLPVQKIILPKYEGLAKKDNDLLISVISDTFAVSQFSGILGIGESVHGSKTLGIKRNALIMDLIKNNKLDILMLEIPAIIGVKFNRYVCGMDDTLMIDKQLYGFAAGQETGDLLNYIRKANKTRQNQIQIAGIDNPISGVFIYSFKETQRFFDDALKRSENELIKQLVKLRKDSVVLYSDKELKLKDRQFWGDYSVSQLHNINQFFGSIPNYYRDSAMFANAKRVIEYFGQDKNYVIIAHLLHLIKDPTSGQPGFFTPLGFFLDKEYKSRYKLIGQFVGSGKTMLRLPKDTCICLDSPYDNSLEQVCASIKGDSFYLTNWKNLKWTTSVWRNRLLGTYRMNVEFLPFSLDYIDAIYYSRYSEAMEFKTFVIKPEEE